MTDNLTSYGRFFVRQPGDVIESNPSARNGIPFRDADGRLIELRATSPNALTLLLNGTHGVEFLPGAPWTCLMDPAEAMRTAFTQFHPSFTFPEA